MSPTLIVVRALVCCASTDCNTSGNSIGGLSPCPVFATTPSLFSCLCLPINMHVFNGLFLPSFALAAAVAASQFALPDI
jgi:hypothetical protein